jgi:hypothetical protein
VIHTFSGARAKNSTGKWIIGPVANVPGFINAASIDSPGIAASPAIAADVVRMLGQSGMSLQKDPAFNPYRAPLVMPKNGPYLAVGLNAKGKKKLLKYDKDNVSEKTTNDVEVYITDPNFTPEVIGKASVASAGLCKWVHAIYKYTLVNRVVIPKRIMLAKASKELSELMGVLEGKRSIVRAVELKIQTLMDELNEANATKEQLEVSVLDCQEKLIRAEKLMRYNIVCLLFLSNTLFVLISTAVSYRRLNIFH